MGGSKYASESALLHTFPKCQRKKKKRGPRRLRVFFFYPGRTDRGAFRLRAVDGKHKSVRCERLCLLASSSPVTARAADTRLRPVSR